MKAHKKKQTNKQKQKNKKTRYLCPHPGHARDFA